MSDGPVVLVGLDAAEWSLVRSLASDGRLPALASLMRSGKHGRLQSVAESYAGGVWPTFYTGRDVPWHGVYHSKLWRHEKMRCEMADASWLPAKPFWEEADVRDLRVCAIDLPMTVAPPAMLNGVQVAGWGTHDLLVKGTAPRGLWRELRRRHGAPQMDVERFGPQDANSLLELRRSMLAATRQAADVGVTLLAGEPWDLFCQVFGAPHRAGHYLWNMSQVDLRRVGAEEQALLAEALVDIYRACDAAVARLVEAAPAGSTFIVFAVHGMRENPGWSDLCPDLLARIQQGGRAAPPRQGLLYNMKRKLPVRHSEDLLALLPVRFRHALVKIWSARMFDWQTTRYFPLPMDQAGYLRINLRDREPGGIVVPGSDYQQLCHELIAALMSWCDVDSGQAIVKDVHLAYSDAPTDAPYRDRLPDLVVTWSQQSALHSRAIRSEAFGDVTFREPGRLPSGRSGNHSDSGWFIMSGTGIEPGDIDGGHIIDLAPTVLARLGLAPLRGMTGQPLFRV
jgi:predicted AlkP superfamily phosphohydrolase/phosphomutase